MHIPWKLLASISSAVDSFRRTWNGQGQQANARYRPRADHYDRLWEYYSNTAFEDLRNWSSYKGRHGLYRYIRQIYNPTFRLVEFYTSIYPGVLTTDARRLPDGTPLAIPLARDTRQEIRDALGSFWEWSNWQEQMHVMLRHAAALGNVLVKLNDEVDRRKVSAEVIWPGLVSDLELDSAGNVQRYALEYDIEGDGGRCHRYREEVTKESIQTTLDDRPFDATGAGARYENPYGFVPAVWYRFNNLGSVYGAPVTWCAIGKLDELNHLVSQIHDQIGKMLEAPIIVKGGKNVRVLADMIQGSKQVATHESPDPLAGREQLDVLYGPPEAGLETLSLDVQQAMAAAHALVQEVERDFPELSMFATLRAMTQTTGPAVEKLAGDVKHRFVRAAAAADRQSVKLFQMGLAIAGMRANSGAWGALDGKRRRFLPFDLTSYEQGHLDFDIDMRPLLPEAKGEGYQVEQSRWTAFKMAVEAGMPLEMLLRDDGWDDARVQEMARHLGGPLARELAQANQDAVPAPGGPR